LKGYTAQVTRQNNKALFAGVGIYRTKIHSTQNYYGHRLSYKIFSMPMDLHYAYFQRDGEGWRFSAAKGFNSTRWDLPDYEDLYLVLSLHSA
jgi:hypothetical protein